LGIATQIVLYLLVYLAHSRNHYIINPNMKTSSLILALASSCTALLEQQPLLSPTSSGVKDIPLNGFGTWNLKGENTSDVVAAAMVAGYR
jgi:hypothetical protein